MAAPLRSAPRIPGLTYVKSLGSGGFSDVYLYEQQLPQRLVAVKVLSTQAEERRSREQFISEANVMAQLSSHPSIVTIHSADITHDRRPYLVMEYCPGPSLAQRCRTEGFTVAEVLRIGIRIASAVETAHRRGILHRDIKPANILTTDYGWPALSDFGLSLVIDKDNSNEQLGLSIPWAPPELLENDRLASPQSDVYSLAATLYTLLSGSHPFHHADPSDSVVALIRRIESEPVPKLQRADVPAELNQLLAHAMAKRPTDRIPSAVSLGRSLQRIESQLRLSQTPMELPAAGWNREVSLNSGEATQQRALLTDDVAAESFPVDSTIPPRTKWWPYVAASVVIAASGVFVAANAFDTPPSTLASPQAPDVGVTPTIAPLPTSIDAITVTINSNDTVTFRWEHPDDDNVVAYAWHRGLGTGMPSTRISEPEVTLALETEQVCISVTTISRNGNVSDDWRQACGGGE